MPKKSPVIRRTFTEEQKINYVQKAKDLETSVPKAAERLRLNPSVLRKWMETYEGQTLTTKSASSKSPRRTATLTKVIQAEIEKKEEEKEILATALKILESRENSERLL